MLYRFPLIGVETILQAGFCALSAYLLREAALPGGLSSELTWVAAYGLSGTATTTVICVAVYWLLRSFGLARIAFWGIALAGLLAQTPSILSYNFLDWGYLLFQEPVFSTSLSPLETVLSFLLSVILLILLHSVIDLRRRVALLRRQRAEGPDTRSFIANSIFTQSASIMICLALTLGMISIGTTVARNEDVLRTAPWAVLAIGGGAILLMAALPALWLSDRDKSDVGQGPG